MRTYSATTCILHREITSLCPPCCLSITDFALVLGTLCACADIDKRRTDTQTYMKWNARGAYTHPINTREEIKPLL